MKLVDIGDLKSPGLKSRAGSIPALGTTTNSTPRTEWPKGIFSPRTLTKKSTPI